MPSARRRAHPSRPSISTSRSETAWVGLASCITRGPVSVVHEPRRIAPVACWPLSQVMHAAALIRPGAVPTLVRGAALYSSRSGFRASPLRGQRFYDDNAWLALAALQHHRTSGSRAALSLAERVADFLQAGQAADGGFPWVEGGTNRHACSTGSAALVLHELGRPSPGALQFMVELRGPDGLVRDHRRADAAIDAGVFSYNQGLLIALAAAEGEQWLVDEALADSDAYFTPDRLWAQPVIFNAIYARCRLRAGAGLGEVREYAERLWEAGSGAVPRGAGRYDGGHVVDAAGAAQLLRLLDSPVLPPSGVV